MRAFVGESARSLSVFSRQAVSVQSGNTSEEMTNERPSGVHVKPFTGVGNEVACTGSPAREVQHPDLRGASAIREKRELLAVGREARIRVPLLSGGHAARLAAPESLKVTIQIAEREVFASTSGVETA